MANTTGTMKTAATTTTEKAKDLASSVADRAEDAAQAVGSGMRSLAGTIRENAPQEGMLGSASTALADQLETGARYLQQEGLQGLADDLSRLIRRNPIPAMLVGIGVGFLLARATTRR